MWKRKELKERAKKIVSKNYWTAIVVCFIIAIITGEFGISITGLWQSDDSVDLNYIINNENIIENNELAKAKADENKKILFDLKEIESKLSESQMPVYNAITSNINSLTRNQKYLFKIWDAITSINIKENGLAIKLLISVVLAIIFSVFIVSAIKVGGRRYFIEARKSEQAKATVILSMFKKDRIINISMIMLLRNIYVFLWYFTIIGGIIKQYEYRMIPYILAQNPKIKRKQAFKLSKEMMKNNKWKTFVLDLSFIGWRILSVLTFGIVGILYSNPYIAATITELYEVLKEKAIKEKIEFYEELESKEE